MSFDGVGVDDNEAVDGAGRYADAGIWPAGEIGRYLRRAAGHPPLAAVTIFGRLVRALGAWRDRENRPVGGIFQRSTKILLTAFRLLYTYSHCQSNPTFTPVPSWQTCGGFL